MPFVSPILEESIESVMPKYNINNIIVGEKNIRLMCSLDTDDPVGQNSWLGSSEFFKYINFYFVVTSGLSSTSVAKVYYPKTRIQSLSPYRDQISLEWEEKSFGLQDRNGVKTRVNGHFNYTFGYIKANMEEIVAGNFFVKDKTSPQAPLNIEAATTETNISLAEDDDVYFEVDLQCDPGWLDIDQRNNSNHYRNIISFCQLDIKRLSNDYNLSNFIGSLAEYGGPLHYEKILELSPHVGDTGPSLEDRAWFVPEVVNYFEDQQGNPHNGIAHHHGENNPGPNGYIGWMSGPPGDGDMSKRKLLSKREIANTKVVSKLFIGKALGFDGKPLTDKNRFLGYPNALDVAGDGVPSPYGSLSFGTDLMAVLRSEVGMAMLEVRDPEQRDIETSIRDNKMKKLVLTKQLRNNLNLAQNPYSWIDTQENCHRTWFEINKEQILKSNSQYGYLLDFHREAIDSSHILESEIGNATFDPQAESLRFIKYCTERSRMYTIKAKRRRVTNLPFSNNSLCTPDYMTYDKNRVQEILAQYSDVPGRPSNGGLDTSKGSLSGYSQNYYKNTGIFSMFILNDYDLFKNVTHGRYKYNIELTMLDGAREYLREFYDKYFRIFKEFEGFLKEAEKPFLMERSQELHSHQRRAAIPEADRAEGAGHNNGSYDYEREQFSSFFLETKADSYLPVIRNAATMYMRASYLINRRASYFNDTFYKALVKDLTPDGADIGNLRMFLDLLQKVGDSLKQRVFKNNTNIEKTMNLGVHKRRVGSSLNYPDSMITLRADIIESVKVESKNSVFYSSGQEEEIAEFFTLQAKTLENTDLDDESSNPDIDTVHKYNSEGETINRESFYNKKTLTNSNVSSAYSKIIAATNSSEYEETYDPSTTIGHSDPLKESLSVLDDFGGATFNHLLSNALSLSETSTNECGESVTVVSSTVEASILDSIVSLDNRDDFILQVEQTYKDHYFKKEALGNLYTFVKHTMSNRKLLKAMNVDKTEARIKKNEHKVKRGISTEQHKTQVNNLRKQKISLANESLTDLYVMTASRGLVLAETRPRDSMGIFVRRAKDAIETSSHSKPVLVNNVYFGESSVRQSTDTAEPEPPTTTSTSKAISSTRKVRLPSTFGSGNTTGGGTYGY